MTRTSENRKKMTLPELQEMKKNGQKITMLSIPDYPLAVLAEKAGLQTLSIDYDQRYSLSNHLYWLSRGQPGGHEEWESLNSPDLNDEYAKTLAKIGKSDTVIGIFEKEN